jgi:hypothetical protein
METPMTVRSLAAALAFVCTSGAVAAPTHHTAVRPDGSHIDWQLDLPGTGTPAALLVLAQGSGCLPALQSEALALIRAAFPEFAALTVEKYGVDPGDGPSDITLDCADLYHQHHTMSQRVADYAQVIESLRLEAWWNGELVLFGGSEGGLVMASLAGEVDADAAILLSTGAGTTFGEIVRSGIPPEGWPSVDAAFEAARQNPESSELWGGYSYRFWADSIDRRAADDMLLTDAALLLIQGGRDAVPVTIARAASDLFIAADRCNLTYWEFPTYDHGMADSAGRSHLAEVAREARAWTLAQLQRPSCP